MLHTAMLGLGQMHFKTEAGDPGTADRQHPLDGAKARPATFSSTPFTTPFSSKEIAP